MKIFLTGFFFFGIWCAASGQEKAILKILNRELKKEVRHQLKSPNFNDDTISIIQPFTIDTQKILSFQIKKTSPYFEGYQIIKQEISLHSIKKIGKDINIILEAHQNQVSTTIYSSTEEEPKTRTSFGNLFFLYLSNQKQNEYLGVKLQEAFQKAGIPIAKDNWFD